MLTAESVFSVKRDDDVYDFIVTWTDGHTSIHSVDYGKRNGIRAHKVKEKLVTEDAATKTCLFTVWLHAMEAGRA